MKQVKVGLLMVLLLTASVGLTQGGDQAARAAPQETVIHLAGEPILFSSLATADFNGDGYQEIVAGGQDGMLYVVSTSDGVNWGVVWSRQCNTDILAANPPTPRATNEIAASPVIADLEGDGHLDIVIAIGGDVHVPEAERENGGVLVYRYNSAWDLTLIEALSGDGTRGWPQPRIDWVGEGPGYSDPDGLWDGIVATPAVGDLDGDGDLEIVVLGIDRRIHAWHHTGEVVAGWPIYRDNGDALLRGGMSSPALGDLDGDGLPEVVVGTMSPYWEGEGGPSPDYNTGTVWAINGDSTNVPGFPIETEQYIHSSPALGDIDADGQLEIVVGTGWGTTGRENIVYAWNHDATPLPNWPRETMDVMAGPPTLGDIDDDGQLEVIIGCGNNVSLTSCSDGQARLYAWNADGSDVPGFPIQPPSPNNWLSGSYTMPYDSILADVDGDGQLEILVVHLGAFGLAIVESDGAVSDYRYLAFDYGGLRTPPLVDDVDNDGNLEILVGGGSANALIVIWDEAGTTSSPTPWPRFRHDAQRTGNVYYGDTTPPQNPTVTSPTHIPGTWSNVNPVVVNWSGAEDAESGIAGYYYAWDTSPTTVVDQSATRLAPDVGTLNSTLAEGESWYFHIRAQNLAGLLAEETQHFGPLKIDTLPPTSQATTSACSVLSAAVSWSGVDDGSGILNYDVQVREGDSGAWTDWKSATTDTSDAYVNSTGSTYQFRSLARDAAGNEEEKDQATVDAQTWLAQYGFSGSVYNTLGQPVFAAQVTSTPPVLLPASTDPQGDYLLCHEDAVTYMLTAARSGFGPLPPTQPLSGTLTGVDFYLPPADDLLTNGQFESGDLSGWSSSGSGDALITGTAHTGDYAVQLGSDEGSLQGWSAALSQSVFISGESNDPALSLMYRIQGNDALLLSDPAQVQVQGDGQPLTSTLPASATTWSHVLMDLDALRGQTVTLTLRLSSPSWGEGWLLVDEVSLGVVEPGVSPIYLPLVVRGY